MPVKLSVHVELQGIEEGEDAPPSRVYAFDSAGALVASAPIEKSSATLRLPDETKTQLVRVVAGPEVERPDEVSRQYLLRHSGYEKRIRLGTEAAAKLDVSLVDPVWRGWFLCSCVVRGRLVQRILLPDGSTQELPICHGRVTICEVDSWPTIVWKLPDDLLWRLRDELIWELRKPFPPPPPPEPIVVWPPPPPPPPDGFRRVSTPARRFEAASARLPFESSGLTGMETKRLLTEAPALRTIAATSSAVELRRALVDASILVRPYLCLWDWLWDHYTVDCIKTVMVDEEGRFETTIYYPCFGDRPDLYFSAEQWNGSSWIDVYSPSVACHTYWNYDCGDEIVINVTNPAAVPCVPEDPVSPPPGVTTWVMPYAVGNMKIFGTPPGSPVVPAGFIRPDGLVDYGSLVDAPFGSTLGLRHGKSSNIPKPGVQWYRWRYRRVGAVDWTTLTASVGRHYVREVPGQLPSFPVYSLGPKPVGPGDLFEFRPHIPPDEPPPDPAGTLLYWPTDTWFGDIYSGIFDTVTLVGGVGVVGDPGATAGEYEVKLEVVDASGNSVAPGPGTFTFIVPSSVASDGTVECREAEPGELDDDGFVFRLHIDNNGCDASIDAPSLGGTAVADECGFLRYQKNTDPTVTIAFHAQHENNRATFSFGIVRGADWVPIAAVSDEEVAAASAGAPPYTGDGNGNFSHGFARTELSGDCEDAAFSENLHVDAKATNGWVRLDGYDADAVRAFALAEQPGPP